MSACPLLARERLRCGCQVDFIGGVKKQWQHGYQIFVPRLYSHSVCLSVRISHIESSDFPLDFPFTSSQRATLICLGCAVVWQRLVTAQLMRGICCLFWMDVSGGLERGRWRRVRCPRALPSSPHLFHLHSVSSAAALLSAQDFTSRRHSEFCIGQTRIFYIVRAGDTAEERAASGKSLKFTSTDRWGAALFRADRPL